jgi:tRNA(Ile)-lysidine synthase
MIVPGDRVAVAISGGADSVALFRLLENLRDSLGITLLVLHFDHCLRGSESDADGQFVEILASSHQVEYICERVDVAAAAKSERLNLEDAARRLRYSFFERIASQGQAARVAVAHTADDQAETVLARLFRGTGTRGLAGIYPVRGAIVRPLLAVRRRELREYLRELDQAWREDLTNQDTSRQRARIRTRLLPVLEGDFSRAIVRHLGELARFAREEEEFWDVLVEDRFSCFARRTDSKIRIHIPELLSPLRLCSPVRAASAGPAASLREYRLAESPLTERLIRRLYEGIHGDCRNLTAVHVEQVLHLATESASGRQVELPDGVLVQRTFGELIFSRSRAERTSWPGQETRSAARAYHYTVSVPRSGTTSISIPELGTRLFLKVIDWSSLERDTRRDDALDVDLLPSTLTLRNWQPGDAYRPRGHRQSRKLKEMFLSQRVPRGERLSWPVVEAGGRIVWVRGMPPAGDFCFREATGVAMVIEETKA